MGFLKKVFKSIGKALGFILKPILKPLKKWLTPKVPDKEALKVPRQGSDQFIPVVYGTREVGAIVVDRNVTDQSGGAANEFLHVMCVFCYGEIDGFEEFYFGDVSWNDKRWLKDKNNPNGAKWFTYELRTGAAGQSAVNAVGKLNSFSSENSKYEGLAVAFFTFQQDKDQSIWQGEPQIKARIRGKKCLDPRTGLTVYTENPAIHLVDYLSNNIYSLGLTSEDYDIQSFINVANISDIEHTATIDTRVCKTEEGVYSCTGTPAEVVTFKRYSHNNIIDTQQSIFDNIQEIANCFRGYFPNSDGRLSVASEMEAGSVFSFNEDNMVSSITSEVPDRNSRFNRVIVRFPNKANNYEKDECVFPDADSQTEIDWLAEDNGTTQEKSITAEYTVYKAEALQLARIAAYVSRYADTITFSATPEANILDVGDVFDVTDSTRGWDARLFRVSDIEYRDDGLVNITGVQHENAVYPWLGVSYTDIIGGSNLGDPSNIAAPFGLTITPDETFATAGLLSWESVNDAFIRRFVINVISGADVIYSTESLANNWPIPLFSAGDYSIQVRAMSTIGSLSPAATIAFSLTASLPPTDIIFNASNFEIEAIPVLLGAGLGTQFDFALGDVSTIKGRGRSIVFTGLSFNTTYTVFARTINALGVSDWFSKEVTTTADSSQIIDLIGDDIYESVFEPVVDDLQNQINDAIDNISNIDTEWRLSYSQEKISRTNTDKALFDTAAATARLRQSVDNGLSGLTDALFYVDKETGQIRQLAYSYTDTAFTQAGVLIDGVTGEVEILAQKNTELDGRITNAESTINVQAGQIALKASYSEVNEAIAGAIDAVIPAYSFGFFNSSEGWSAVNGTLTPASNKVNLVYGDITNQSLSYSADENPVITLQIERTGGTGWAGDLIVTFSGGSTQTYLGVIADVAVGGSMARVLNLGSESTYTGTVTGIRFRLGESGSDTFTVTNITVGKPSATLEALDGITAQVNQLGVEIDAVEGSLTNYVTTAAYTANTVTFSNLDVTLNGAESIISLNARLQEYDANDVITKANSAAIWIDASESNITQVVESYNAQPGGIDDQLASFSDDYTIIQSQIDAQEGLISDQIISISRLGNTDKDIAKNAFYAAELQLKQKNNMLGIGESISTINRELTSVSTEQESLSQSVLQLSSSFGSEIGQLNASVDQTSRTIANESQVRAEAISNLRIEIDGELEAQSSLIQDVQGQADGTSSALAGLTTRVLTAEGDIAESQLILDSTVDELGQVSARAFLGTSTVVDGKAVVNGIVIDGASNAMEFRTNTFVLANNSGVPALYWDGNTGKFVFNGRLVIDGYSVNSEADIRALDGDTIYEIYQYSVNGTTNWHATYTTGDIFRRTATVTNGVTGPWSAAARITGLTGDQGPQGDQGVAGQVGAGFYGSTYATISWTTSTANARFLALVGRNPVNGDIFTQTLQTGTDSQARQYNGSSWVTVALQVNGSIVASGTIAGDKLIAGTSITAPVINGGQLNISGAGGSVNLNSNGSVNISSASGGSRMVITSDRIEAWDGANLAAIFGRIS